MSSDQGWRSKVSARCRVSLYDNRQPIAAVPRKLPVGGFSIGQLFDED